ncbi:ATP-dependent DNA ligase [Streptomyces mirabilis]|uniref:ATP-dependent DNA ligase n=1 Tax=Streptomyces mirabilis TaxID=68239 RepID=UPI0036781307
MDWPVSVALAQSVPELPTGTDWSYEVKLDGHRMIMWRTGDGVRLQARSGRDVTAVWGDLALAGHHLPAGTVLDGEAVITTEDGQVSFEAAQARAASSPVRARRLASQRPAHYITGVRTGSWVDTRRVIGRSQQVGDPRSRRPT